MSAEEQIERLKRQHKRQMNQARRASDEALLFEEPIPEEWLTDYALDWDDPTLQSKTQGKYAIRRRNMRRSRNRMQLFAPELIAPNATPMRVFEMSTAHGAMLEVCRYHGHKVLGNDYVSCVKGSEGKSVLYRRIGDTSFDPTEDDLGFARPVDGADLEDWVYRPIIDAIDMPIHLFDGGAVPYPLKDKSQDYLFCMQAIEHYTHPDDWMRIIGEFCRITTTKIVILLNWNVHHTKHIEGYEEAFHQARLDLRNYNSNGFQCTAVHLNRNLATGFALTRVSGNGQSK